MKTEQEIVNDAIEQMEAYFNQPRFKGIKRLYSARQVVEQQGTIRHEYPIAKEAAKGFSKRLRQLFNQRKPITTFGPYTPGQAVMMKRAGIEGIYIGGWATSAKGSAEEDPGSDLASYPLSQVPKEAASIVRALLAADKNQHFERMRMSEEERKAHKKYDYRPFIIADADTGHGGDAHVRNLIRRFVEVGVTGYHIEDQKPGTKKCGHQGGKVLVSVDEQIKRLNTARLQLDIMKVPGIIVARTDAEAASLIENMADERDQPFLLGATNLAIPSYKHAFLVLQQYLHEAGATHIKGHLLYDLGAEESQHANRWLDDAGILQKADDLRQKLNSSDPSISESAYDKISNAFVKTWESAAGVMTYQDAVANQMAKTIRDDNELTQRKEEWLQFASNASMRQAQMKAAELGANADWDCELARTPEGYYQIKGGIPYAIAKSLAVAPYADILWMETKTANLADAKQFADAIHAQYPDKMLAYNLSPSFNWDTTGMTDEEMKEFPAGLGKMGFVFNFVTYGGHQIDGLASDEFANAIQTEGMLALARIQRQLRLLESPYRTPQTLVGGPRLDSALAAASGRTATTKSMGKGSTQFQHLKQTELPPTMLQEWIDLWRAHYDVAEEIAVDLKPHLPGSSVMELSLTSGNKRLANIIYTPTLDRKDRRILSIRDQNLFRKSYRQKRLMTLMHVFLFNRYRFEKVHYLTPSPDNIKQCEGMQKMGIYGECSGEESQIIVGDIVADALLKFMKEENAIQELIRKESLFAELADV
ncbi:MAG: isocitrate lyase family protein [Saprospiraceae bacterium]|nr:isocitrate lyase family protein [Saprospiraceae bacterium]